MKSLAILVFCGLVATAYCGCFAPGVTPSAQTNTNCAWYNSNSCCTSVEADASTGSDKCANVDSKCTEQANLFACGIACSPDISSAVSGTSLKICSKFADHLYSSCSASEIPTTDGTCKKLGDVYKSGQDYIQAIGMTYDTSDSSPNCFNAAGVAQPAMFLVVAAVLALFFKF